jgi:hypothetical protein
MTYDSEALLTPQSAIEIVKEWEDSDASTH